MDYDMSIHTNPDAVAWARFYRETKAQSSDPTNFDDEENMVGWFANAMMAMHDYMRPDLAPVVLPDGSACFVADVSVRRPDITVRNRTEDEQNAGETGYKHE